MRGKCGICMVRMDTLIKIYTNFDIKAPKYRVVSVVSSFEKRRRLVSVQVQG